MLKTGDFTPSFRLKSMSRFLRYFILLQLPTLDMAAVRGLTHVHIVVFGKNGWKSAVAHSRYSLIKGLSKNVYIFTVHISS